MSRLKTGVKALNLLLASHDESDRITQAMNHILKSQCLNIERWIDLGIDRSIIIGPLGKSYRDVLKDCCGTRIAEFIIWLCRTLTPLCSSRVLVFQFFRFWDCNDNLSGLMDRSALLTFALERNNHRLAVCLGKRWTKEIRCHEPPKTNPVFKEILKHYGEDFLLHPV
jgi:hypothetical protein